MARFLISFVSAAIPAIVPVATSGPPAAAYSKPNSSNQKPHAVTIRSRAIRSFGAGTGRLRFRGGLVLSSSARAFGGYSGLEISPDGKRLMAVSDAGTWLTAKLTYSGKRPTGLSQATIGPILALSAKRLRRRRDRDSEAIRLYKGSLQAGIALVAFEGNERIGFFKIANGRLGAPVRYLRPPQRLRRFKGLEATALLRGGRHKGAVIAFAERTLDPNGHHRGWLWKQRKRKIAKIFGGTAKTNVRRVFPLAVTDQGGFDITDVAGAPDGSLYLLERRFRWSEGVKMRVRRVGANAVKPGALLKGETLIQADLRASIDNMEGLAVHQTKDKRTVLTLISDNNFNSFLQRTMLLQFEVR